MSNLDLLLAQGIAAVRAGERQEARRLLSEAVQRSPGSEAAWLWLSSVLDTTQGRAFCLQRVLAINPANQAARRGLRTLESVPPAPVLVARPAEPLPPPPPEVAPETRPAARRPRLMRGGTAALVRQTRFWQVVVACLAVVALGLVAALMYATLGPAAADDETVTAAVLAIAVPGPRGTLRPTFTATATPTATPTSTWTPTATPTSTWTPTPTDTPTPTPQPTRRRVTAVPSATPAPRPTLPPRAWDPRLDALGVRIEPVGIAEGQFHWRLVEARWADEREAAGKHSIYVEALNAEGHRAVGQPVIVQWADGNVALPVQDRPLPEWGVDFGMYNCLGSYAVSIGGAPSDRIVGLGLGTAERPNFTIHTSFYLVFRLVRR